MIEEIKKNLEQEKKLVRDIDSITKFLKISSINEKEFYLSSLNGLVSQLKILNNAIPELLNSLSPIKSLVPGEKKIDNNLIKLNYLSPTTKEQNTVTINKKYSDKFVKELKISQEGIKNIKDEPLEKSNFGASSSVISRFLNRIFASLSEKIVPKIPDLSEDLKRANINILVTSYVSISLLVSSFIFILSIILLIIFTLSNSSLIIWSWVPFLLLIISLTLFYFYPKSERSTVNSKISQELPFATIYMSAISGSNVEPTRIFKIISNSKEYPTISTELKKVINQIEVYGYDLVSSLKNAAKKTANENFSELLGGIATNISSGGNLKDYLDKKTENFLTDYRLERQKYNSLAELFMDIYISVLITGPLIMMVLFMIMNLGNFQIAGLSMNTLFALTVGLVIFANIIFLVLLDIKQPKT